MGCRDSLISSPKDALNSKWVATSKYDSEGANSKWVFQIALLVVSSSTEFLHYFLMVRQAYFLKEWYGSHIYIELKSFFLEIMVPVTSEALDDTRNTSTELPLRRCPGILHSFGHRVTSNEKYLLGNYNWPITSLTMSHHFLNNFRVIITGPSLP